MIARNSLLLALVLAGCAELQRTPAPTTELPTPQVLIPPAQPPAPPPPPPAPAPGPVVEPDETQQVVDLLGYYQRVAQMNADDQRRELNTVTQAFNRDRSSYNRLRLALLHLLPGTAFQDDTRALQLLEPLAAGGSGSLQKFGNLLSAQATERMKTQKRADQMKDQLEALRAIERSLIERGQQPQPRKP